MSKQHKPKTDFEKKLEREAKLHEPMFWLIPEWLQIIKPMDLAMRIEHLELELEMRRIGQGLSKSGENFLVEIEAKHRAAPRFITNVDGEITHYFLLGKGVSIPEETLN